MVTASGIRAGRAFIELALHDDQFKKQLQQTERKLQNIGRSVATAGAKLAAFGGAGVAGFAAAIKSASAFEETLSKFNVVFGQNSEAVKTFANDLASELGRSKAQILGFLASSQDLFVPLGFDTAKAEEMSKQITRLAVDLASFNNIADDDALRDLQAALTGSGEVMKKYGVIVSEAAVKQQLLNEGIDPKTATEQQKVMARLNIILAGTTAAQGDAIRTADGFANQMKRLQGNLSDVAVSIGQAITPALAVLAAKVNDIAQVVVKWVSENQTLVIVLASVALGVTVLGTALVATGAIIAATGTIIGGLTTALTVLTAASGAATVALGLLASPVTLAVAAIGGLILAIKNLDKIKSVFGLLGVAVSKSMSFIKGVVQVAVDVIKGAFASALKGIIDGFFFVNNVVLQIMRGIGKAIDFLFGSQLTKQMDEAIDRINALRQPEAKAPTPPRTEGAQAAKSQNEQKERRAQDASAKRQQEFAESLRRSQQNRDRADAELNQASLDYARQLEQAAAQQAELQEQRDAFDRQQSQPPPPPEALPPLPPEKISRLPRSPREFVELMREQQRLEEQLARQEEEDQRKARDQAGLDAIQPRQFSAEAIFGGERAGQIFGNVQNEQLNVMKKTQQIAASQLEETKKTRQSLTQGLVFS